MGKWAWGMGHGAITATSIVKKYNISARFAENVEISPEIYTNSLERFF